MPHANEAGGLEIGEDDAFQRRTWYWQRILWAVMASILVLGLLGLFGDGPISRASVGDEGGSFRVEYRRFARRQSETTVEVVAPPGAGGEARIWVDRDYADRADIRRVDPDPSRIEAEADGLTYVVPAPRADRPVRIELHLYPEVPGTLRGRIRAGDGPTLDFTQFIYP